MRITAAQKTTLRAIAREQDRYPARSYAPIRYGRPTDGGTPRATWPTLLGLVRAGAIERLATPELLGDPTGERVRVTAAGRAALAEVTA